MTTLSSLGGGGIKSIQRGTTTANNNSAATNATITAVDMDKSFVSINSTTGLSGSSNDDLTQFNIGGQLTSTTVLTLTRGSAGSGTSNQQTSTVYWEVIEYV